MKVLFCGDILSNFEGNNHSRSGIFFVACALLKEFSAMENVHVTIYCSLDKEPMIKRFLHAYYPEMSLKTLSGLPHRRFKYWFEKKNENRIRKVGKALRGRGRLESLCETLDKLLSRIEARAFDGYDVFFSPCEAAPTAAEKSGISIYTIVHDLIPVVTGEYPVARGYWLYYVLRSVSPEKYYFCVSDCTRRDFIKQCPDVDETHVKVVYNGYEPRGCEIYEEEAKRIIQNTGLIWKRYILILGNVVPHKNVERQIRAGVTFIKKSGLVDFRVAVVGSCSNTGEILDRAQITDDDRVYVTFYGYVPDDHIRAYYRGAFCLSFTSLYEGFGLPVLEAMSEDCPVVTSNTSSLPEVAGDAAICISPEDMDAHVEAYTRLLNDHELRNVLINRGKEQVKRFRWNDTAQKMIEIMKNDRK